MKGREMCYTFLKSGKNPSDHQEELPSKQVDREAMAFVMRELYQELSAFKSEAQIPLQEEANETSEATQSANGTPAPEQRESDATDAFFDATETGENMTNPSGASAPEPRATAETPVPVAPESGENMSEPPPQRPKLCKVNWGKAPCPATEEGSQCAFVHLDLCTRPQCLIRENRGDCTLWHGHLRGMLQREKARRRREAEQKAKERADKADRQEYERWQARRKQTKPEQSQPGNNGRGKRSSPHQPHNAPKAQSAQGQPKFQGRRGHPPSRGDFLPQEEFPPLQRRGSQNPQSVWETAPDNAMEQFRQVYQMFQQFQKFLNAGAMQQQMNY